MSWVKIWVHLVFTTKNREPMLERSVRKIVFQHIRKNARGKEIYIDCVNGFSDHCHCLISLGREQTISKVAQLIKGESSFWINKQELCKEKFKWQDDYWAASVSESHVERLRRYIFRQEEHHNKQSFNDEIEDFEKNHGGSLLKQTEIDQFAEAKLKWIKPE